MNEYSTSLAPAAWKEALFATVEQFSTALEPDDVVIGGGAADQLDDLPLGCRRGGNDKAFQGGFRVWGSRLGRTPQRAPRRPTRALTPGNCRGRARQQPGRDTARTASSSNWNGADEVSRSIPREAEALLTKEGVNLKTPRGGVRATSVRPCVA